MRLVKWLEATERMLDVVRIALEEAHKAREQDEVPPPPTPVEDEEMFRLDPETGNVWYHAPDEEPRRLGTSDMVGILNSMSREFDF